MKARKEALDRGGSRSPKAGSAGVGDGLSMGMRTKATRLVGDGEIIDDNIYVDRNAGFARAAKKETTGPVKGGFQIDGGMNG